jgi:TonB family protein
MWNWTSQPGIKNMDSIGNMISYPKEAERSNISGSVFIRVLIDKNGEVFCYQVLSELGECFNKEGERLIKHLKFNIATIDNKAVAYEYSFPITFKPEELKKKR